jgi:hypothetical protein
LINAAILLNKEILKRSQRRLFQPGQDLNNEIKTENKKNETGSKAKPGKAALSGGRGDHMMI